MTRPKLDKIVNQAKDYLYRNEIKKAMKLFKEILYVDPLNDNAWLHLGIIKHRAGEYDAAIKCYRKATELNNLLIVAWGLLAVTYIDQGKRSEASKVIEESKELNPSEGRFNFLHNNLDQIYLNYKSFLNRFNSSKSSH